MENMRFVMVCSAMRKKEKKTEVETIIKKGGVVVIFEQHILLTNLTSNINIYVEG